MDNETKLPSAVTFDQQWFKVIYTELVKVRLALERQSPPPVEAKNKPDIIELREVNK